MTIWQLLGGIYALIIAGDIYLYCRLLNQIKHWNDPPGATHENRT